MSRVSRKLFVLLFYYLVVIGLCVNGWCQAVVCFALSLCVGQSRNLSVEEVFLLGFAVYGPGPERGQARQL